MDKHIFGRANKGQKLYGVIGVLIGILGVLCGALAAHLLDNVRFQMLYQYIAEYFRQDFSQVSVGMLYQNLAETNVLAVLKVLFLGFCLIGAPFVLILVFSKGFSLGFTWGIVWQGLLAKQALAGVGALFLAQVVPIGVFLAASAYAMQNSWDLFLGQNFTERRQWLRYLLSGAAFGVAAAAASCLEGFLLYNVFADLLSQLFT